MNPRTINSTNVKTFGFKTSFDTENSQIKFDIDIGGLTVFETGGAAAIAGVSFELIDPFGSTVHALQFGTPDINPDVSGLYTLQLPGSTPAWGIYKIKGVLKEADSSEYEVVIPAKNVCEPKGFDNGKVPGSFKEKVDCNSPYVRLNETTNLTYLSKSYSSITKTGNLYYPLGTISPVAFTSTPFQNNVLYTGDYVVRNKSIADYDLGDYFFVRIAYETAHKFSVTCQSQLCDVACCIEEVYSTSKEYCNTPKGIDAKKKLESIQIHVLTAVSKERCGKDSGAQIKIIKDILKCDCDCNSKLVEPVPISSADQVFVFEGECAAEVSEETEGSTTTVTVKVKNVLVVKDDEDDDGFSIERVEDNCNITWKIKFDYANIAANILNEASFVTNINNLIGDYISNNAVGGIDIREINGRCIMDLSKCDFSITYDIPVNGATINNVIIGGTTYDATGSAIAVNNPSAIEAWLDGLGKGNWNVSYSSDGSGGLLVITANGNENEIQTAQFTVSAAPVTQTFNKVCTTLEELLDRIIQYLCALDSSQVSLGEAMSICNIVEGVVVPTAYGPDTKVSVYLKALATSYCNLVNTVSAITGLTCSSITGLFGLSGAPIGANDYWLGTKSGVCAKGTMKELAIFIFELAQTDPTVREAFCSISCEGNDCPAPKDLVVSMGGIDTIDLDWNSEDTAGNPAVTGQRIAKRIKAIGGAWDTSGFDSANDMDNDNDNNEATVTNNRVYEFLLQSLCSEGGPVNALNGIQEGIAFNCINPIITQTHNAALVKVTLSGTDITKVRFTLKLTADDTIVGTLTAVNSGVQAQVNFTGLTADTQYYLEIEFYAMVNGVEVISSAAEFLNAVCTGDDFEFTTNEAPEEEEIVVGFGNSIGAACADVTTAYIPDDTDDVEPGVTVYVDSGLTTPATGFNYVRAYNGKIYNMNNLTGEVGSDTGSNCGGGMTINSALSSGNQIDSISPAPFYLTTGTLPVNGGSAPALGRHGTVSAQTFTVTVTKGTGDGTLYLYVDGDLQDSVAVLASITAPYTVDGTFTAAQNVEFKLDT